MKIAAGDDGAEEEVAVGNVVDAVAGNIALESRAIDCGVDLLSLIHI